MTCYDKWIEVHGWVGNSRDEGMQLEEINGGLTMKHNSKSNRNVVVY